MSKELTQEERERTKRQKLIEGWDQKVIKNSTVFIAGIGALGCEIGKDLALMGVGKLMLCDLDKIETSNLSRQMLFYKGDEGRYKAEVAAERLKLMNPYLETEVFTIPLQQIAMEKYLQCQVIVAALDNVQARMDLNKFALKLGIPMVEGGTVGFEGHVQVVIPESAKTASEKPFPFGNQSSITEQLLDEKLWRLEESEYPDYFSAQKKILQLQDEISRLEEQHIAPVKQQLRDQTAQEILADPTKYMHHTPCYRCMVPIPPPLRDQVAACTLKGIPRTREHCAIRGEVQFMKAHDRKPDYGNATDMEESRIYAQKELDELRTRILAESIPPEYKDSISPVEVDTLKANILETFGADFLLEDMENILGNKIPAIQTVSSIISSIQSQEVLKLIFLKQDRSVGPIMDPSYINYNGIYGIFEQLPVTRREDCVACGSLQGQENLQVVIPLDSTVGTLLSAIQQVQPEIQVESWFMTNPLTKQFIYNPMFEKGRTELQPLTDFNIKHMDEITLTAFGEAKQKLEIKQYNVLIQMI